MDIGTHLALSCAAVMSSQFLDDMLGRLRCFLLTALAALLLLACPLCLSLPLETLVWQDLGGRWKLASGQISAGYRNFDH